MTIKKSWGLNVKKLIYNIVDYHKIVYGEKWKEELNRKIKEDTTFLKDWIKSTIYESLSCSDNLLIDWSYFDDTYNLVLDKLNTFLKE